MCKIESLQILDLRRLASLCCGDINHCTVEPQSPMGQKKLAVLTGNRINEGSFTRKCMAVLPDGQKKRP